MRISMISMPLIVVFTFSCAKTQETRSEEHVLDSGVGTTDVELVKTERGIVEDFISDFLSSGDDFRKYLCGSSIEFRNVGLDVSRYSHDIESFEEHNGYFLVNVGSEKLKINRVGEMCVITGWDEIISWMNHITENLVEISRMMNETKSMFEKFEIDRVGNLIIEIKTIRDKILLSSNDYVSINVLFFEQVFLASVNETLENIRKMDETVTGYLFSMDQILKNLVGGRWIKSTTIDEMSGTITVVLYNQSLEDNGAILALTCKGDVLSAVVLIGGIVSYDHKKMSVTTRHKFGEGIPAPLNFMTTGSELVFSSPNLWVRNFVNNNNSIWYLEVPTPRGSKLLKFSVSGMVDVVNVLDCYKP